LTKYVKVAFFRGASLKPTPPGASKQEHVRFFDIYENTTLDEDLMADLDTAGIEVAGMGAVMLNKTMERISHEIVAVSLFMP